MFVPRNKDRDPKGRRLSVLDSSDSTVLLFMGSCMVFSDRLLRTVEFEFDEVEVLRMRDVQGLDTLENQIRLATKLIIFDEANMDALLSSKHEPDQLCSDVDKVLAYVSPEMARSLQKKALHSKPDLKMRFLPMKAPLDAWLAALRLLILGEAFVPAELLDPISQSRALADEPSELKGANRTENSGQSNSMPKLTEREIQVLGLVADGLPNKSIADKLSLSEHTVKLHVHHIFGKLGVQNRASATNWYFSRGEDFDGPEGR